MNETKLTIEEINKVRSIEGFPVGTDDAIIALSDVPYYTACPNPYIEDFIRKYGKQYDEGTDNYRKSPFSDDVGENKHDLIYNIHIKCFCGAKRCIRQTVLCCQFRCIILIRNQAQICKRTVVILCNNRSALHILDCHFSGVAVLDQIEALHLPDHIKIIGLGGDKIAHRIEHEAS